MPVPPKNLPRLVPEKPPVLELRDVDVLVKLSRAEIASGLQAGKPASAALEVLGALARVEAWHHYETAHRDTRYGTAPAPPTDEVSSGSPGESTEGANNGDPGPVVSPGTRTPFGDLPGVSPLQTR